MVGVPCEVYLSFESAPLDVGVGEREADLWPRAPPF